MFISNFRLPQHRNIYLSEQLDVDNTASSGDGSSTDGSEAVNQNIKPIDSPPGVHRFIGVISVGILLVLISLWFARRRILRGRSTSAGMQDGDNLEGGNTQRDPNINTLRRMRAVATGPLSPAPANSNSQPQRQSNGGDVDAIREEQDSDSRQDP